MKITGIRIDSRLLHGLVATQWAPLSKCTRIMVIDDRIANDFFAKEMMRIGKPAKMNISILDEKTALTNLKNRKYEQQKLFILIRDVSILESLLAIGMEIPNVNLGITEKKEGAKRIVGRIYVSDEEKVLYQSLVCKGIKFYIQFVPSDKKEDLSAYI